MADERPLAGDVALVTGGASGIGEAGAIAFAELGAAVMVADLNADGAAAVAAAIVAAGGRAASVRADVTDEGEVHAMVASTIETFGSFDCAFNNAGNALGQWPLHELPLEEWQRSIDVNLTGTFLCLKHELAHMRDAGGGRIVNTASGAARVPAPGRSPYSAAKRGVVALTAHAARDYAGDGIRVNAVLPGLIDTPAVRGNHSEEQLAGIARFLPGGRLGAAADVADVAAWLCTDGARHVNGQALVVDGGSIIA